MNKLFYGDNLDVMRKFIRPICVETVDLCYIDPPFNSKRILFLGLPLDVRRGSATP